MFYKIILIIYFFAFSFLANCSAESVKWPEFGGQFYPSTKEELSSMIDNFLEKAPLAPAASEVFMLISPHAGYGYSGQVAAFGYKLVKNKNYKTVIILGTSHRQTFSGAAFYPAGSFVTSLGKVDVDEEFIKNMIGKDPEVFLNEAVFSKEHSVEVQLPFLQKILTGFKIVPVVIGDCSLESCAKIAALFKKTIGQRKDVLVVVSTDLYHGYDFKEAEIVDKLTLDLITEMNYQGLYYALRDGRAQACGGFATVVALNLAKELGYQKIEVLNHTNSASLTGKLTKGDWTVGYVSCAVFGKEGEKMLNLQQKQRLLEIARESIKLYLQTGKKLTVNESDPMLNQKMGAFVTLNLRHELRGCIGNLIGNQPLYLTVRDMAIEAAVDDPRFSPLSLGELKEAEIEISALSPLEKVFSTQKIELGKHGVLVQRGNRSGVFLPQVATETGWSKEEFLNNLCTQKAGLLYDAWKQKDTDLYIFTADVFSEKEIKK
jgi:AmmeMemoRadiSam system protein B/AmmeMemoRadiSam system protein A